MRSIRIWITGMLLTVASGLWAQAAYDFIVRNWHFSASNYCIYPDSIQQEQTPPPAGKRPFYLSHYSRHGSRYLNNRKGYDIPYKMLCKADSTGQLTALGKDIKNQLAHIIRDSEGRWGDLSDIGKQQLKNIATRMVANFPEIFEGEATIQARSTTVNRCVMSMGTTVQQLVTINPKLKVDMNASKRDTWYLNHQDAQLRDSMKSKRATDAHNEFWKPYLKNPRLMKLLFVNPDSLDKSISEKWINYYLLKTALIQQNTHMDDSTTIINLFTNEDIYHFWQIENAWWYIQHGGSLLNGGYQPYSQRSLLRKLIAEADSCIRMQKPIAQLRFGHETVILPLVCLLGLNGFDFQTSNLEELEPHGWWACMVFPMSSNIQFVFYRSGYNDKDIIFKVLLNEKEATLPLHSNIAPYYHWSDFCNYYLQKLEKYDMLR